MLGDNLNRISLLVEEEKLVKLRTCEIWIERHHPTLGGMQYHPDWAGWKRTDTIRACIERCTFRAPPHWCHERNC